MASTVSESGDTINLRPIVDMPTPVRATRSSNLSVRGIGRTERMVSKSSRLGWQRHRILSGGFEEREPHVFLSFEHDPDGEADVYLVRWTAHDVGGQAHSGVFLDGHDGDDVRVGVVGEPATLCGRMALDDTTSRHVTFAEIIRSTSPTDRCRRVLEAVAGQAVLKPEPTGLTRGPVRAVPVAQYGVGPGHGAKLTIAGRLLRVSSWWACPLRRRTRR